MDALTLYRDLRSSNPAAFQVGNRELSVLETARQRRKPVATALTDRDSGALRQVMERELARSGAGVFCP